MKKIQLTQGKFALVDDEDFEELNKYKWNSQKGKNTFYAVRFQNKKCILMHRFILNTPQNMVTDHANGNGLDNQRSNLRVCTYSQNTVNRKKDKDNTTGFKGIYRVKNKFAARICMDYKRYFIGVFDTKEDAYRAYCAKAMELHGEFVNI